MPFGAGNSKASRAHGSGPVVNLANSLTFQLLFLAFVLCSRVPGSVSPPVSRITFAQVCSSSITNKYSLMKPQHQQNG